MLYVLYAAYCQHVTALLGVVREQSRESTLRELWPTMLLLSDAERRRQRLGNIMAGLEDLFERGKA